MFADRRDLRDMSVGDDVFMLGLFIDEHGKTTNVPKARFGHVSMLPNSAAPLKQPTGYEAESFVIDAHSRSGFSGSPVFLYRNPLSDLGGPLGPFHKLRGRIDTAGIASQLSPMTRVGHIDIEMELDQGPYFRLIGMHWGQFAERWEIERTDADEIEMQSYVTIGSFVNGFSGMTCTLPAWQIQDVLQMPELRESRDSTFRTSGEDRGALPDKSDASNQ
jgi:hypothetical protein